MTISELLKNYRLEQRKSQEQWVGTIISKSFYSKVEKNLNRISADDLINLLHYNRVPLIDFFSKLDPTDQSVYQKELEIDRLVNEAYYQNSKDELYQIRDIVACSSLPNKEDELFAINTYIALIDNNPSRLDKKLIAEAKTRIFTINNFDKHSLMTYCNLMNFNDFKSNLLISKKIVKEFIGNDNLDIQRIILSIIINMLISCIHERKITETKFFIRYADQIRTHPDIIFYKMIISIFSAATKYYISHDQIYLDKAEKIIDSISFSGMQSYSQKLQKLLFDNK